MANSIEYYRKLMGTENYNTDNECKISQYVDEYNSNAQNYISSFDILINTNRASDIWLNKVNGSSGIQTKALIDYGSEYNISKLKSDMCKIQTYANTLEIGGYITKKSSTDDSVEITYLTIEKEDTVEHNDIGYMQLCNYTLTYKSPLDSTQTIQTPCIVEDAVKYSSGVNEDKLMSLPDGQLLITLPDNELTQSIKQDYRLMFYKKAFKVTYDNRTQEGLVKLTVVQVARQDGDTDEIADNSIVYNAIPNPTGTLIIDGSDSVVINREQVYEVRYDDTTPHSADYRFDLSDTGLATITNVTNMTCVVRGLSKGTVILTATNLNSGFTITKTIVIKSLL